MTLMTIRWRLTLLILGLTIVCVSLAALVYAAWPLELLREQTPLAPTLFTPP